MSGSEGSLSENSLSIQSDDIRRETESDSVKSASKISDVSSSAQKASSVRGRSKKRRIKADAIASPSRKKRLKISYSNEYRKLFNETLKEVVSKEDGIDSLLSPSQIGVSLWSAPEKILFFSSLSRKGRHDIQSIAAGVGSKSESEVYVYMDQLQNAARDEQIYELAPKRFLRSYDIDAALEISERCCSSLDLVAEALSLAQQREEVRLESEKFGELALLSPKVAGWADRCLQAGETGEDEVTQTLPAAHLLNLEMFLKLSKRIFMNSSVFENNWRNYAKRGMRPSIMYTAFSDFHNVVISLTKRLVQSCLFFAMSRLRALNASGRYTSGRNVRRGDVVTALNTLGMELKGTRTWAGMARKCHLRVYDDIRRRQGFGKRYSYDEVEEILSSKQPRPRGRSVTSRKSPTNTSVSSQNASPERSSADETEESNSFTHQSSEDDSISTYTSSDHSPISHSEKQARKKELLEQSQNIYAEAHDQRASRDEERRLWTLLSENPEDNMETEKTQLPKAPPPTERKDKEDLVDWKSWVNYIAEWQKFETPVPASSFAENRRNFNPAAGLTDSDTESDDVDGRTPPRRRRSTRRRPISEEFVHDESSSEQEHDISGTDGEGEGEDEDEDEDEEMEEKKVEEPSAPLSTATEGVMQDDVEDSEDESQEENMIDSEHRTGKEPSNTDGEEVSEDIVMHSVNEKESEDSDESVDESSS